MKTVDEVIEAYIKGTYTADTALLQEVFHPAAIMTGYLGEDLLSGTPQPFIEDIGSQASMESLGHPYQAEVTAKTVTGKIAEVTVKETGFRGEASLEDHFHLFNDGSRWFIISKLFTVL